VVVEVLGHRQLEVLAEVVGVVCERNFHLLVVEVVGEDFFLLILVVHVEVAVWELQEFLSMEVVVRVVDEDLMVDVDLKILILQDLHHNSHRIDSGRLEFHI